MSRGFYDIEESQPNLPPFDDIIIGKKNKLIFLDGGDFDFQWERQ